MASTAKWGHSMATDEIKPEAELEFLDTLYGDPIRTEAMKAGRNLVVAGLLLLAVARFGATVQSTPLFPISFAKRPEVLPTVLAILVVILALNFLSKVLPDLLRFREVDVRIIRFIETQRVATARAAAEAIDASEPPDDEGCEPDPWWEHVAEIQEQAKKATAKVENRLGVRKLPRMMRIVRVVGEVGLPIGLASFAMWEASAVFRW